MNKVAVAIIGAGWWGTTAHLPALKNHPHAELLAVQSRDPTKARKIADDYGIAHTCTTLEQVLALPNLDAVVISSTPNAHYEQAMASLEAGKHVLIEKPMTITVKEAHSLVASAKQRGLHLLISCPWHYTAHGIEARRLIRSGKLGQLKMISVLMTNFTLGLYKGLPWDQIFGSNETLQNASRPYRTPGLTSYSDRAIAGGGQIYCQVSHAAAYLGFLTGRWPREVFARFSDAGIGVDIYDTLNIRLDDDVLVSLASTGATMLSERNYEVRIFGTQGMVQLELWKGQMAFHDADCHVTRYPDLAEEELYPMFAPAINLVDVVRGEADNGSPGELGLYSMEIIEAACASADSGRNIAIRAETRSETA